jgi:GNAT superfamily N-acetyltransferase
VGIVTAGGELSAPEPITPQVKVDDFSSGKPPLDDWLHRRALKAEGRSARTYVVAARSVVVGYYCFAAGAVRLAEAPKPLRRNMPDPVPVILLGRLAVDQRWQGRGIGKGLLKDALLRALAASLHIGARAVLVHAIDDDARAFYEGFDFVAYPAGTRTLFLPMETIGSAAT